MTLASKPFLFIWCHFQVCNFMPATGTPTNYLNFANIVFHFLRRSAFILLLFVAVQLFRSLPFRQNPPSCTEIVADLLIVAGRRFIKYHATWFGKERTRKRNGTQTTTKQLFCLFDHPIIQASNVKDRESDFLLRWQVNNIGSSVNLRSMFVPSFFSGRQTNDQLNKPHLEVLM